MEESGRITRMRADLKFQGRCVEKTLTTSWERQTARVLRRGENPRKACVAEAWVETPVDATWIVAYRLVSQSGAPVVAEMRIFPTETAKGRPAGSWSADVLGVHACAPPGGIPAELLRQVSVTAYRSAAQEFLGW